MIDNENQVQDVVTAITVHIASMGMRAVGISFWIRPSPEEKVRKCNDVRHIDDMVIIR